MAVPSVVRSVMPVLGPELRMSVLIAHGAIAPVTPSIEAMAG